MITSADNSWPPSLPFHTALKRPQPNIFTLYQHGSPSQTHTLTHIEKHTLTHIDKHKHTHTHTHTHTLKLAHSNAQKFLSRTYSRVYIIIIIIFFFFHSSIRPNGPLRSQCHIFNPSLLWSTQGSLPQWAVMKHGFWDSIYRHTVYMIFPIKLVIIYKIYNWLTVVLARHLHFFCGPSGCNLLKLCDIFVLCIFIF